MSEHRLPPLEDEVLDAFRHAYEAKRFDAAEHLLRALETLQGKPQAGTALRDAYLMLDRSRNSSPYREGKYQTQPSKRRT